MKKIAIVILALIASLAAVAQQQKSDESNSKTLEFLKSEGSCLVKEFYDLGSVKGVSCKVLIITNVVSNKKIGCMRLETSYFSSATRSSDTYIGTLDADEIDACLKSLSYLKDNLFATNPLTYTEAEYKSRDKVTIGAFFSTEKNSWTAYVQTKSYTSRSSKFFDATNLEELSFLMQEAKKMIEEKIK